MCTKSAKCTHVGKDFIAETTEIILIKFGFRDKLSKLRPFFVISYRNATVHVFCASQT